MIGQIIMLFCPVIGQIDLMGQSVYEYAHPCDHEEIQEVLGPRAGEEEGAARTIFVRFKCTLTSKGRNVNLKSASYKVGLIQYINKVSKGCKLK